MSVYTKGVALTENKDVFAVCRRVEKALRVLFRDERGSSLFVPNATTSFAPRLEIALDGAIRVIFKYVGEYRQMWVHFNCDCDVEQTGLGSTGLVLSMGCWGSSEVLMRAVLNSLKDLGPCYIDVNDCDEKDYVAV